MPKPSSSSIGSISRVFVTVGTTQFPSFVYNLLQDPVLEALKRLGCQHLVIQSGSSRVDDNLARRAHQEFGLLVTSFPYKDSIETDIQESNLVLGHAGAGTTLEVLRAGKPLIVVINESLMGNHQVELAEELDKMGYLISCTPKSLPEAIDRIGSIDLTPFPTQDMNLFRNFLHEELLA